MQITSQGERGTQEVRPSLDGNITFNSLQITNIYQGDFLDLDMVAVFPDGTVLTETFYPIEIKGCSPGYEIDELGMSCTSCVYGSCCYPCCQTSPCQFLIFYFDERGSKLANQCFSVRFVQVSITSMEVGSAIRALKVPICSWWHWPACSA